MQKKFHFIYLFFTTDESYNEKSDGEKNPRTKLN